MEFGGEIFVLRPEGVETYVEWEKSAVITQNHRLGDY